jgi:hypothetical protein
MDFYIPISSLEKYGFNLLVYFELGRLSNFHLRKYRYSKISFKNELSYILRGGHSFRYQE